MNQEVNLSQLQIENRIFTFRGLQVMIDRDLAELYNVEVKRLNEQVKRNIERFPISYRFQLNEDEKKQLVAICDRFDTLKHSSSNPYAFTEQGVAMLSAVLRSDTAINVSIQIINAFVAMRKLLQENHLLFSRLDKIEIKQLETDQKFEKIFKALELNPSPQQGIFYDGQIFDAWLFAIDLVKSANKSIILIDNYVDETILTLLSKRKENVTAEIYTQKISKQFQLDLLKYNSQYDKIEVKEFSKSHDRFLIIDRKEVYFIGAL
ncbi:ORF6N domain-containing protein [Chryseobacterium koreense]|uniref:ORF6N domain-containing protein n=1 Tax=Chryseobacterium koreense TaxID=232216 RepID=UPI0034E98136